MGRRAAVIASSVTLALLGVAGPAAADAPAGPNNCAGVFVSELAPAFVATEPPTFGRSRSELAKAGVVGEMEKAATEALASCGTP